MDRPARGTFLPLTGVRVEFSTALAGAADAAAEAALDAANGHTLMAKVAAAADVPAARGCDGTLDMATMCPCCVTQMQPEHAHYRCSKCAYRDACCF